jgi:selenocysteine lyase/cysteine desulfurase
MSDLSSYRKEFPVCKHSVYLNHAGVAPTSTRVRDAVAGWMERLAERGMLDEEQWEETAEACRTRLARLIHATADEIAFVRNTSHGLSLVSEGLDWQEGDRVAVATELEYPSNVYPWLHLAGRGVEIDSVESSQGSVTVEAIEATLRRETRLVSVSSAQYATGALTDLEAIGTLCRDRGLLFCVDGIQTLGALEIDVKKAGVHFLAADSHKWLLGMPGIGVLYLDRELIERVRPVLVGWKSTTDGWNFDRAHFQLLSDARKLEEGSPPYALISGLQAALELLEEVGIPAIGTRIRELIDRLAEGLPDIGAEVAPRSDRRHHILTFTHPRCDAGELLSRMTDQRFVFSKRRGRLRVSPHFYNTEEEIDRFIAATEDVVTAGKEGKPR